MFPQGLFQCLICLSVWVFFWPSISLTKYLVKKWNTPDPNSKCCDTAFHKTGGVLQGKSPLIMWSIILEMLKDYIKAEIINEVEKKCHDESSPYWRRESQSSITKQCKRVHAHVIPTQDYTGNYDYLHSESLQIVKYRNN